MRLLLPAVVFLVSLLSLRPAGAAGPVEIEIAAVEEEPGRLTVTIDTRGPDGKSIPNLSTASFKATLDGAPLTVSSARSGTAARGAIGVVLAVDVSGSMRGDPITQAQKAMVEFLQSLNGNDVAAIIAFDTTVRTLRDFTADRTALSQTIEGLNPVGDTALYDAVIEATRKAATAPTARKLVVLLSDGQATVGLEKRAASLEAAKAAAVPVVAIGLGSGIDRQYLSDLASASGGRFLEAPTPAALRQAYADLAAFIRGQYTLTVSVPEGVDRSRPGTLVIRVTSGADSATAQRVLAPLAGAVAPPFTLGIAGLAPGQKVKEPLTLVPEPPPGLALATVEYAIDGQVVHSAAAEPFSYGIDPAALALGNHLVTVIATDASGRRGEKQIAFAIPSPARSVSVPVVPIAATAGVAALLGAAFLALKRRKPRPMGIESRIKPWAGRVTDQPPSHLQDWPQFETKPAAAPAADRVLGCVVVLNEEAVRAGNLDTIQEYQIGTRPLTLGTRPTCDIVLEDDEDRIAGEEARLWVQKGRLVFHKLTTLSAMATEGVTSGWQILDNGEELRLGLYRIAFHAAAEAPPAREEFASDPRQTPGLGGIFGRAQDETGPLSASFEEPTAI